MESSYKIYCYLFENNNKIKIPENFNLIIDDISVKQNISDEKPYQQFIYKPNYECINYLMAFNIEKYNEKSSYLINAYKKNNIKYYDNISSSGSTNDLIFNIINSLKEREPLLFGPPSDDDNIINQISVEEDDYICNIGKGNNKLFTLIDLFNHLNKTNETNETNETKNINISIITMMKDIKYLHKRCLYNYTIAPLNRHIMQRNEILFNILKTKNINTVTMADDVYNREIVKKKTIKLSDLEKELLETNYTIITDVLNIKDLQIIIDTIYMLNEKNYDGKQLFENFIEDYKMKEQIIKNYNDIYNKFQIYGFDSLPTLLKEIYHEPYDMFFRNTYDASKIINNLGSYCLDKKILNICYEEYNITYNYEVVHNIL